MKELEQVKNIFLTSDIDTEDYQDNLAKVTEWEKALTDGENYQGWLEHDITKKIALQAKNSYVELSMRLVQDRRLSESDRLALYAKQDACLFLLSLTDNKNIKDNLEQIHKEIAIALSITPH